jgi:hypothetical protein
MQMHRFRTQFFPAAYGHTTAFTGLEVPADGDDRASQLGSHGYSSIRASCVINGRRRQVADRVSLYYPDGNTPQLRLCCSPQFTGSARWPTERS